MTLEIQYCRLTAAPASTVHRAFASAGGATTHLLAPAASFRAAQQPAASSFVAAGDAALAANALE